MSPEPSGTMGHMLIITHLFPTISSGEKISVVEVSCGRLELPCLAWRTISSLKIHSSSYSSRLAFQGVRSLSCIRYSTKTGRSGVIMVFEHCGPSLKKKGQSSKRQGWSADEEHGAPFVTATTAVQVGNTIGAHPTQ